MTLLTLTNEAALIDFINQKREQNISKNTLATYEKISKLFISFLQRKEIKMINSIRLDDIHIFINDVILARTSSDYTLKLNLNTVKMFLRHAYSMVHEEEKIKELDKIKILTPEVKPIIYSRESIEKVNKKLEDISSSLKKDSFSSEKRAFSSLRNYVMLRLLIECGVKYEELSQVRLCDISLSPAGKYLHVKVSRARRGERELTLKPSVLFEELEAYKDLCSSEFICSTYDGRHLYRREVEIALQNFFNSIDVTFLGTQAFKHTFAKKIILKGYSNEQIRYLLGYRNSKTIEGYKKFFNE